jgi:hypothetical protein
MAVEVSPLGSSQILNKALHEFINRQGDFGAIVQISGLVGLPTVVNDKESSSANAIMYFIELKSASACPHVHTMNTRLLNHRDSSLSLGRHISGTAGERRARYFINCASSRRLIGRQWAPKNPLLDRGPSKSQYARLCWVRFRPCCYRQQFC